MSNSLRARGASLTFLFFSVVAGLVAAFMIALPKAHAQKGLSGKNERTVTDNEAVFWLAASPAYRKTGLVLAVSLPLRGGCAIDCFSLWVTRDGGARWTRIRSRGFPLGFRPLIVVDSTGREKMVGRVESELLQSIDGGETWTPAGPGGWPSAAPNYAETELIALAGEPSYLLRGGEARVVAGSGGALGDFGFMLAPDFPKSGLYPPALLAGLEKESSRPLIQQCGTDLSCTGGSLLVGTGIYRFPILFYPSEGYASDGVVFVTTGSVYKSDDGGVTFEPLKIVDSAAIGSAVPMLALAPRYKESGQVRTAYAALSQVFTRTARDGSVTRYREGGVYKTIDGGRTWTKTGEGTALDEGANAITIAPDGRVFAGFLRGRFDGGLLCSEDGAKTWHRSCSPSSSPKSGNRSSPAASLDVGETRESVVGTRAFWMMILLTSVAMSVAVGALVWNRRTVDRAGSSPGGALNEVGSSEEGGGQ